jgi:hypothetical protein
MNSFRKIVVLLGLSLLVGAVPLLTTQGTSKATLAIAYAQGLWPPVSGVATVYYTIDSASDPNATPNIDAAIKTFNADFMGVIQWVPWTSSDGTYYVDINLSASDTTGVCEANEGYENKPAQPMDGSTNCTIGTILHEMGHVIGLWHEQNRTDRASYITVSYPNVIKGSWGNFQIQTDDVQILGPYDYASVMQYPPYSFSATGLAVIETSPAGMPLSSYEGVPALAGATDTTPAEPVFDYSAGDKETVLRLYGAAPKSVTVTSNPVGLSVVVDGVTVTTPQTYAWPLYSVHTLNVVSEVQSLSGYIVNSNPSVAANFYYTFGRWNNSTLQSQSITVTPGTGSPTFPSTSPQVATYSANFVQLVPYTTVQLYPSSASGSASISPAPQTYFGGTTAFFIARRKATLTATANTGWNFYEFNNGPYWLPGGLGLNPKGFDVPDTGNPVDPVAEFSDGPVYTVTVTPETFSSGIYLYVDSNFVESPHNFSAGNSPDTNYDPTWTAGSPHTLSFPSPEYPYSSNTRYSFSKWSTNVAGKTANDGEIKSLPAAKATYTATVIPQFAPATNFSYPPCGGTGSISPSSPTDDGFYPTGTELMFSATAGSGGWEFGGWTDDLTGNMNPTTLTPTGETLVFANFNIDAAPLTLTKIQPASVKVGSKGFVMTLTGTGFSPDSNVSVNGFNEFLPVTYVSATTLKVTVPPSDYLDVPGGYQVFVENFPTGWQGCAVFGYQTFLVEGKGPPVATPVFSPKAEAYTGTVNVSISDAVAGATIYYTTDGTTPTTASMQYTAGVPIVVMATETLKADATATGYVRSAVATAKYTITTD